MWTDHDREIAGQISTVQIESVRSMFQDAKDREGILRACFYIQKLHPGLAAEQISRLVWGIQKGKCQ